MKIVVLTSSRADYSIYLPLLNTLRSDSYFLLSVIPFGTHLSKKHGETINEIIKDGFNIEVSVDTMVEGDDPVDISTAIGKTILAFSKIWENDDSDLILALGDRYEMFSACAASVPFGKKIAHIHGGETTCGAIDDFFRTAISEISIIHFVTTQNYKKRVAQIKGSNKNIYNVGALSIDNFKNLKLYSLEEFKFQFGIDMSMPSILITFHPETINYKNNEFYCLELLSALKEIIGYQYIITMPNADTYGLKIRKLINEFIKKNTNAIGVESFGTIGYLSCMKHCSFMLGNTSSGFVEASFFPKYVINLGERQTGRIVTENIRNCDISKKSIKNKILEFPDFIMPKMISIYGDGNSSKKITKILKKYKIE